MTWMWKVNDGGGSDTLVWWKGGRCVVYRVWSACAGMAWIRTGKCGLAEMRRMMDDVDQNRGD